MTQFNRPLFDSKLKEQSFLDLQEMCLDSMRQHPEQDADLLSFLQDAIYAPVDPEDFLYPNFLHSLYESAGIYLCRHPLDDATVLQLISNAVNRPENDEESVGGLLTMLCDLAEMRPEKLTDYLPVIRTASDIPTRSLAFAENLFRLVSLSLAHSPQTGLLVLQASMPVIPHMTDRQAGISFYKNAFQWMRTYPDTRPTLLNAFQASFDAKDFSCEGTLTCFYQNFFSKANDTFPPVPFDILKSAIKHPKNGFISLNEVIKSCLETAETDANNAMTLYQLAGLANCHKNTDINAYITFAKDILAKMSTAHSTKKNELAKILWDTSLSLRPVLKESPDSLKMLSFEFETLLDLFRHSGFKSYFVPEQFNQLPGVMRLLFNCYYLNVDETTYVREKTSFADIVHRSFSLQQRALHFVLDTFYHEHVVTDKKISPLLRSDPTHPLIKLYYQPEWMVPAAFSLVHVFESKYMIYLKKALPFFGIQVSTSFLNEALNVKDRHTLSDFLIKNVVYVWNGKELKPRSPLQLQNIVKSWPYLTADQKKNSFGDVLDICLSKLYVGQKAPVFAEIASRYGIAPVGYLDFEAYYRAGLDTPEPFDSKKRFTKKRFTGRFLPRSDARVGFFGEYTGCCQHLKGIGVDPAISSMKDIFSQLFVVENKEGEIVAGSWVWQSVEQHQQKDYLAACFDSLECTEGYRHNQEIKAIFKEVATYLTEEKGYYRVTYGKSDKGLYLDEKPLFVVDIVQFPKQYRVLYTDADKQYLMAKSAHPAEVLNAGDNQLFCRCFSVDDASECVYLTYPRYEESTDGLTCFTQNHKAIGGLVYNTQTGAIESVSVRYYPDIHKADIYRTFIKGLMKVEKETDIIDWTISSTPANKEFIDTLWQMSDCVKIAPVDMKRPNLVRFEFIDQPVKQPKDKSLPVSLYLLNSKKNAGNQ